MKRRKYILIIFLIAITLGSYLFYKINYGSNKEIISYSDKLHLIIEENKIEDEESILFIDSVLYFSLAIVRDYIDSDIFYDESEKTLIITSQEKVNRYKVDEEIATVNNREFFLNHLIREINNNIYIPMDRLLQHYELTVNHFAKTNSVIIDFTDIDYLKGESISNEGIIRTNTNLKAPIIERKLSKGTILNIYEEYDNWYKVRTMDGILGYIEKKQIKLKYNTKIFKTKIAKESDKLNAEEKIINLTWDYTYGKVTNTDNIKKIDGVNVISPTWFSLKNEMGEIIDRGNKEYVRKYNELGHEVWALFDNSFDPDLTHEVLSKSTSREKIIKELLGIYEDYGFQGINIDFENVHLKTKDYLTQFVRELYPLFKESNMYVSIDITGLSTNENWSMFYDRARLQETVDYMILMAYDQHWASSPVAGSVAEYPWVERSLLGVLEYIPNNKLILAVPFYTRVWKEENNKLISSALTMTRVNEFIDENDIELTWDHYARQYYGEIKKNNIYYRLWLEDVSSLKIKASLIHKYDLAGLASWRKGYEIDEVWTMLEEIL